MTTKEMAQKNYDRGLWTKEMIAALVKKGALTVDDYKEITGEDYSG